MSEEIKNTFVGWDKDHTLEAFKQLSLSGQSAIKACFIINGGAAVAWLAFIGHAIEEVRLTDNPWHDLLKIQIPFCFGVLLSACAFGVTYIANLWFVFSNEQLNIMKYGETCERCKPVRMRKYKCFRIISLITNIIAMLLIVLGYYKFYIGISTASNYFLTH